VTSIKKLEDNELLELDEYDTWDVLLQSEIKFVFRISFNKVTDSEISKKDYEINSLKERISKLENKMDD
jgi:hypothetical protein